MSRAQREQEHFNEVASGDAPFLGNSRFDFTNHPCLPEIAYLRDLVGKNWKGLRVLDLGTGLGEAAISFAKLGAHVTAVDVSEVSLERASRAAKSVQAPVEFVKVSGSKLPFPDEHFDLVFGNGVLHHLELSESVAEISRVTKKSGFGFFIEPTTGNPAIAVYRMLASKKRSPDEHPLTTAEYALIHEIFPRVEVRAYQCVTLLAFFKMFLLEGKSPNKHNYWREPILFPERYESIYRFGIKWDNRLRKVVPRLFSLLSWNRVLVMRKD